METFSVPDSVDLDNLVYVQPTLHKETQIQKRACGECEGTGRVRMRSVYSSV